MKHVSLAERLQAKLQKLGLSKRKATTLAQGVTPTAQRAKVSGTVTEKLVARLIALGLTKKKAAELAKGLAPVVRASIKAKAKQKQIKLAEVEDEMVNQTVEQTTDEAEDEALDKVAPRVNGHRVRLDLPVVRRSTWMNTRVTGIEILRVMDGLTTEATYLVAAVKSDQGIVAVRQLGTDFYNVKFYPTMRYWDRTPDELLSVDGASEYLQRQWYERVHVTKAGLAIILKSVDNRPKIKQVLDRLLSVTATVLVKAFDHLHKRIGAAA